MSKTKTSKGLDMGGFNDKLNAFFFKNRKVFLGVCLALCTLLSYLQFDGRLSFATDDATYVKNAHDVLAHHTYPMFQGAAYPFFLSILIAVLGFKLSLLKMSGILFLLMQIFFLYKAFINRIPAHFLFLGLLVASINLHVLQYGSFTFTEAFYMGIQALFIYSFSLVVDALEKSKQIQQAWKVWLFFGFSMLLLTISKNAALAALGAVILYFLMKKEWLQAGFAVASFVLFKLPYELITRTLFTRPDAPSQLEALMRKSYYDPSKGNEDISGFIDRFLTNLNNFSSWHIMKSLGLRGMGDAPNILANPQESLTPFAEQPNWFLTLIFVAIGVMSFIALMKHNRIGLFVLTYLAAMMGLTYFVLQTDWYQERLIVIYIPLIVIGFLFGLSTFLATRKWNALQPIVFGIGMLMLCLQFASTAKAITANSAHLKMYGKGEEETILTYDQPLQDFANLCIWAGTNIKEGGETRIGTNKPAEAFVLAKKELFSSIPAINMRDADSALAGLKKYKIEYLMLDQLGYKTRQIAATISQKYPEKLEILYKIGDGETASLMIKVKP